jgi:hypothetical protein
MGLNSKVHTRGLAGWGNISSLNYEYKKKKKNKNPAKFNGTPI